ncbi:MAG: hypothetical protein QNJ44_09880 [Rhodobacter sp.]|nr:hypothetical protein [Rhodobacter sp.]
MTPRSNPGAEAAAERRAKAWTYARRQPELTPYSLRDRIGMSYRAAARLLRSWHDLGLATMEYRGSRGRCVYAVKAVFRDAATAEAARTSAANSAANRATGRGNMWRAMRGLKVFSATDIAVHATAGPVQVAPGDAAAYCETLRAAGYLRREPAPGRSEPVYRLLRNTGIHAPVERQMPVLWDENLREYTHAPGILT